MNGRGIFGRGNINVNTAESVYRLNPANIFFGILLGLMFQSIVLLIVYFALESTVTAVLICLILMAIGDWFFVGVAVYSSRLYLREEMIDMASMFASYNPQILNGGNNMISGALSTIQAAKNETKQDIELRLQLEQLRDELVSLRNDDDYTPLIDGD